MTHCMCSKFWYPCLSSRCCNLQIKRLILADVTHSDDVRHGACGTQFDASRQIMAAVSHTFWTQTVGNTRLDPLCNQCIDVTHNGKTWVYHPRTFRAINRLAYKFRSRTSVSVVIRIVSISLDQRSRCSVIPTKGDSKARCTKSSTATETPRSLLLASAFGRGWLPQVNR